MGGEASRPPLTVSRIVRRGSRAAKTPGTHWLGSSELPVSAAGQIAQHCQKFYRAGWPTRQAISQKSASSRVASLKIAISSASRAGVA